MWRLKKRISLVGKASYVIRKTEPFSMALKTISTSLEPGWSECRANRQRLRGRQGVAACFGQVPRALLSRPEGRPEPPLHYCEPGTLGHAAAPRSSNSADTGSYTENLPTRAVSCWILYE